MRIGPAFLKSKHLFRRLVLITAVLTFSVTSVVSVFTPAYADNSTISNFTGVARSMDPQDQARSYAYYKFLRQCFSYGYYSSLVSLTNLNNWISAENARANDWFAQPSATLYVFVPPVVATRSLQTAKLGIINNFSDGVVNVTDDSQQDCFGDTFKTIMGQAVPLWGYSSGVEILCDIGFKPESTIVDQSRCDRAGETGWRYDTPPDVTGRIDTWYKDKIGFKSTSIDAINPTGGKYMLYLRTFEIYCASSPTDRNNNNVAYPNIQVLEFPDTTPVEKDYDVRDASHNTGSYANFYEGGGMNCGDLAKELQKKTSGTILGMLDWILANEDAQDDEGAANCTDPVYAARPENKDECVGQLNVGTSCNIPGIGWLICPVLSFGAYLADGFYKYLLEDFLATNPSLVNSDPNATIAGTNIKVGTGTYIAWGIMRNIANVAFVIAILIIIFSQLLSIGISNYGVKKLLPRIIVAALLVNLSFFICQIAVDVSNILGYTMKDMLAGVAQQVEDQGGGAIPATTDESGHLGGLLVTVIAVAAISWINIGAIFVAIAGGLVALGTIFVILIVRKVLIVLLIVVAPLAFVAYLLPNTEQYFHKWRKAFTSLLLLFPIIGLLYGGSILASTVLLQAVGTAATDEQATLMKIAAYTALVVPLIAAIPLLRSSLSAFGSIGSAIQNAGNRFGGLAKNKTQKTFDNSRLGQFKQYRQGQWDRGRAKLQSGGRFGGILKPLNALSAGNRLLNRGSGKFGDKLSAQGDYLANKEDSELLEASNAKVSNMKNGAGIPLSTDEMFNLLDGKDVGSIKAKQLSNHDRRALASTIGGRADAIELNKLVDIAAKEEDAIVRNSMTDSIYSSPAKAKMPWLGSTTRGDLIAGSKGKFGKSTERASTLSMREGAGKGKITAESLALGDDKSVNEMVSAVESMAAGDPGRQAAIDLLAQAYRDFDSPDFDSKLKANVVKGGSHDKAIQRIAGLLGGGSSSSGNSGGNPPPLF